MGRQQSVYFVDVPCCFVDLRIGLPTRLVNLHGFTSTYPSKESHYPHHSKLLMRISQSKFYIICFSGHLFCLYIFFIYLFYLCIFIIFCLYLFVYLSMLYLYIQRSSPSRTIKKPQLGQLVSETEIGTPKNGNLTPRFLSDLIEIQLQWSTHCDPAGLFRLMMGDDRRATSVCRGQVCFNSTQLSC